MTIEKKLEVLKKHNQYDGYDEGRFIDAQDTVNTWCLGQISQIIDPKTLKVHYDGWSTKWDVTMKINNYKLAPFRKWSKGYTGQVRVALRQNMKFSLDQLAIEKDRVQKLIDDELKGLGAFMTTQYFRGQLYTYVDFLLQNGKQSPEETDAINDYLYTVLRLIVAWFKKASKLIPLFSQIKLNPDLFMIDENIAILQCSYELMDLLKKILGGCQRCIKYYCLNDKAAIDFGDRSITNSYTHVNFEENNLRDDDEIDGEKVKENIFARKGIIYGQMINFFNQFNIAGGFEAIIQFMKAGNETQEERMPLDLISLIVAPFRTCNSIISPAFAQQFTTTVREIVQQRLMSMTEKELKEIDKESVSRMLKELKDFFTLSMTDVETAKFIELNQLNISLRFLRSTYLEKKLKGLSEIKQLVNSIEAAQQIAQQRSRLAADPKYAKMMMSQEYEIGGKERPPKYITAESLRDWILEQKVIEIIFGENTHVEIVKRSGSILKFLANEGVLPSEAVDMVWKCQIGKHSELVRVVFSIIQELVPSVDITLVDRFFAFITQVPSSQYDDKFLEFLKDFTLKALHSYHDSRSQEQYMEEHHAVTFEESVKSREVKVIEHISEYLANPDTWDTENKQYGLPIFWDLLLDKSTNVSTELTQQSIACLTDILRHNQSQPVKISYLLRALDNLRKGESVAQSVIIAQSIISDYPSEGEIAATPGTLTQEAIITALESQIQLVNRVIVNIEQYHTAVCERSRSLTERNKSLPDDVSNFTFIGKHHHSDTLEHLLGFLEFLIISSGHRVTLGCPNIDRVWGIFVQQPNFNSDQTLFLKWINKHRDAGAAAGERKEFHLFNEAERVHFFTKILCNPTYVDFQKISIGQVKCFHKFFKVINGSNGNLEIHSHKKILVAEYENLIGLDTLRHIAVESENDRSREDSMDLLVDLHLKFTATVPIAKQAQIWANFIDHCMAQLDSSNETLVQNSITLLSKFLDRYEGKKTLKQEAKSQYNSYQQSTITILLRPEMTKKQVQISIFQSIGHLRVKIAEAFGFHINEFQIGIKNTLVDPDDDDDRQIREFGLLQNVVILKNPNYNPENHPKNFISQKQENYDMLFALLSRDTKSHLIETTWELLMKLPINQKLYQDIKDLQGMAISNENKQVWEKILDPKSINKLLYSLQIVSSMNAGSSTNPKDFKQNQWRYKFIQMGGLSHLLRTFLSLQIKGIESNLTLKCIELLILTLSEILHADRDANRELLKQNTQLLLNQKDQVVHTCIMLVDMIGDYSLAQEVARGESFEDIQKRIIQNKLKKNKYKSYMAAASNQKEKQEDEEDHESTEYSQMQQIVKQFNEQQTIVNSLFKFMQYTIFMHDTQASVAVAKYENLGQMLLKTTLKVENQFIRNEVLKRIKEIIVMKTGQPEMQLMLPIIKILLIDVQKQTEGFESRGIQFYDGVTQILDSLSLQDLEGLKEPLVQMIGELGNFIFKRELKEKNTMDPDQLLIGKMKILRSLLQKFPQLKVVVGEYLTQHLVHECLFDIPRGGNKSHSKASPPKCKSYLSRSFALKLLAVLCRDCPQNLDVVLRFMHDFNMHPSWRTNKDMDWNISLMDSEKSSTGYVGIKNLGCICYMNSLFQQLFMIKSLRNDVLQVPENTTLEKDDNMFYQLQLLFAGLLKSEKQYVNPKGFCQAFKDWDGNPTNVLEQMDVEEFFNMLMDRIETAIKETPMKNSIQYHFGGKYASELICKGCPHKYERSEAFLSVGVPVKNQKSIQQGLLASVQGEMLEGDNAYYCEKCDKKVDTLRRTCIKRLPRYLMLPLKRFEFDYDRMIRVKVNDYCEFPLDLNMEPYTQEGLSRRERIQKLKDEKGDDDEALQAAIEEIENEPLKYPKEYYEYSLSGIVVHSGTADSGHYYSFIKDREHPESGKWYEMNDSLVRDFDPKEIPGECFGGEDTFVGYNMMQMKSMKLRNAYLLFYERKTPIEVMNSDDEAEKVASASKVPMEEMINTASNINNIEDVEMEQVMSSRGLQPTPSVSIANEIEQKILYENQKYWQNRFLFGNEYHDFVYDLSLNWNTSNLIPKNYLTKNNDFHITQQICPKEYENDLSMPEPLDVKIPIDPSLLPEFELRVFKFAASCYLTIIQRAQNKTSIPQMLNLLKAYINKNEKCARWLISEFCCFNILDEMLIQSPSKEMRRFTGGLLYCALLKLYPEEKAHILDYIASPRDPASNNTVIGNFILVLLCNLFYAKQFSGYSTQYLQLFSRLASLGPEIREFMLKTKTVGRLLQIVYDDCSPHKEYFRDISDLFPKYLTEPEIGLPTEVDKKQLNQFQQMIEKKRLKAIAENLPKYRYIYETISYCVRSFVHGEPGLNQSLSPHLLERVQFQGLLDEEKLLLLPEATFFMRKFNYDKKNKAIKALGQMYTHICWNQPDEFEKVLQTIQTGCNQYDYNEIKPYLGLLTYFLQTPGGQRSEGRFEKLIILFLEILEKNQIYYKFMEQCIEYLFKLTAGIPLVFQWFYTHQDKWKFVYEWQVKISYPTDLNGPIKLYKRRQQYSQYAQVLRQEAYRNSFLRDARQERFKYLQKGTQGPADPTELENWLLDMEDYKFKHGEQFELFYKTTENVQSCIVEQVLDEMIQYKVTNYQNENGQYQNNMSWFSKDSNKIQPFGTYKTQYRIRLIELLEERSQQASQMRQGGAAAEADTEMAGDRGGAGRYPSNNQEGGSEPDDEDSDDDEANFAN